MQRREVPLGTTEVRAARFKVSLSALALAALLLLGCTGNGSKPPTPARTTAATTAQVAATDAEVAATANGAPAAATVSGTPVAAAPATPAPVAAQSPSRVETVKEVYDLLLDRYYKPLKSTDLLPNAWKGATQVVRRTSAQLEAPKLSGDRTADWQAFATQYGRLFAQAGGGVQGTELAFGAVDAMATGLHDDHTYFLNPEDNKRRLAEDAGGDRFIGVGITISQRAPFTVQSVIPGGPADKGGVRPGDTIQAVDGADTSRMTSDDLSKRLRGDQAGSQVRLTLKRGDGSTQELTLARAEIVQPALESKLLSNGVGYIALHSFSDAYARFADGRNIAEELDAALQSFEQAGVKGWVFDLRGNPGGSEQTLAEAAGRFLPDGIVLVSVDREGHTSEAPVDGHLFGTQRPLAVLINGESASASELFAATMKEYGRARLFGQRTAGAVNGGEETELPDGAAIQYTVVEGRSGKDHKLLDGVGVSPDETVSGSGSAADVIAGRSDPQLDRASQWVLDQAKQQPTLALKPAPPADTLAAGELKAKLEPLGATPNDLPPGPARDKYGYLVMTYPNEVAIGIAADAPNAAMLEQKVRDRHWQGGFQQFFGAGAPSPFTVEIDLYKDESGAHDAVRTNDFPGDLRQSTTPAKLGEEATAYAGYDAAEGISQIVWRRGRVVITVQYAAAPGEPGMDLALALARRLDARAASRPAP